MPSNKAMGIDSIDLKSLKVVADIVANSIARLINLSIATGNCPSLRKTSIITPVYKSGEKLLYSNYRPISILPLLSKIWRKLVSKQVLHYLNTNNILEKYYSGFRKHHSTETALTCIADKILIKVNKGMVTPTIMMYLCKAFDTIDHTMLQVKLLKYGFDLIQCSGLTPTFETALKMST